MTKFLNRTCKLFLLIFSVLVLPACQTAGPAVDSLIPTAAPQTATLPPAWTATVTTMPTLTVTETPVLTVTTTSAPRARRVVILSIDGLRPDAISLAPMPNLLALMQSGAYSLTAQTVRPSVTLVSHASMLGGVCPSKHGVDWNDYIPQRGYALGTDLFDITHAAGLRTDMYVSKQKLVQLTEPRSLDNFVFVNDRDTVLMERLIGEFPQDFGLLFIHFGITDGMGHAYGWLSPEQLSVIFRADEALGLLLAELETRNLRHETLIIVTADHGGHGTTHGSSMPEDMTIPWIAAGPGIQPRPLTTLVHTMDTAASAAFALGLDIPAEWDGVPVYEAFGLPVERQSATCP